MASNIVFNGTTYSIPADGDSGWGPDLTAYFISIASNALQKTGGTFTLTAEANFGATYGLKLPYIKSQATNPSATGIIRLGNAENISWRDNANSADIALTVNSSDVLTYGGTKVILSGAIVNADISASAAIALTKLAPMTGNKALVSNVGGFVTESSVTSTEIGYISGVTSAVQTQINAKADDSALTAHIGASSSVHGVSGSVVGTSDTQALTNKTINGSSNTVTNISLTTAVTGTLPIGNGGTGQTTKAPAFDALSPMSASGDIIYGGASGTGTRLAKGSDGQALILASGIPSWAAISVTNSVSAKTANYTLTGSDYLVTGSASGGAFTLTLPTAVGATGKEYLLKRIDQTLGNIISIATTSSQTIDGVTSTTLATQYEHLKVISDGANWIVLEHYIPSAMTALIPTYAGFGTVTDEGVWWWRDRDRYNARGVAVTGTVTGSTISISLPANLVINSAKLGSATDTNMVGEFYIITGTTNPAFPSTSSGPYVVLTDTSVSTNLVYISRQTSSARFGKEVGSLVGSSTRFRFEIRNVPITNWRG